MKKNRLIWGMGLMLICGAIILALPWLMDRNNWDKDWDKPVVKPLWKTKGFFNNENAAFSDDDRYLISIHPNGSISQWQTSNGKHSTSPLVKVGYAGWKLSANGKVAAKPRPKKLQRSFLMNGWARPWIRKGNTSWRSDEKILKVFTVGVWTNCGFDLYDLSSSKKRLFLPSSEGARSTLTDGKKPVEGADEIFLSDNGKRACILSTLFDPRGNDGYGQTIHQLRLYDCLNGRLLSTRTVLREQDAADYRLWESTMFSNDGQHFYEIRTPQREFESDSRDKVEIYDWLSDKTTLLPTETHLKWDSWNSLILSPDGNSLAAVLDTTSGGYSRDGYDGTTYVWNLKTRSLLYKFREENFAPDVLLFSHDNKKIAVGGQDYSVTGSFAIKGKLLILNAYTGQVTSGLSEESPRDLFQQSKLQQQQKIALRLGTYKSPRCAIYLPGDSGPVHSLAFSLDGSKLAAGYDSGELKMWKVPKQAH